MTHYRQSRLRAFLLAAIVAAGAGMIVGNLKRVAAILGVAFGALALFYISDEAHLFSPFVNRVPGADRSMTC